MLNDHARIDLLGIGARKAGTTSVWRVLVAQPWFAAPRMKESHYFDVDRIHRRGPGWYDSLWPDPDGRLRGEITPAYLHAPQAAARIAAHSPDVRLFVILRDPVSRFISDFRMQQRRGAVPLTLTIEDFLTSPRHAAASRDLAGIGDYSLHLRRYLEHFGRHHLHVTFLESMVRDPERELSALFAHVAPGRDWNLPKVLPHANREGVVTRPRLNHVLTKALRSALVADRIRLASALRRAKSRLISTNSAVTSMVGPEVALQLRDRYAPGNADLSELLGVTLPSEWSGASQVAGGPR